MEVTKWLKPSISVSRSGDSASVQAATRVNVEQASKKDDVQADPTAISGKAEMAGRVERRVRPAATPGYWRRHVHKESARNTGSPKAWSAITNRKPVRDRLAPWGGVKSCPRAGCGKSACPVR